MLATAKSCMFQPHAWSHVIIECFLQSVKRQSFSQVHNILRQNEKKRKERKTRTLVVSGLSPEPRLYRVQSNKGWQFSSGFLQTANLSQK